MKFHILDFIHFSRIKTFKYVAQKQFKLYSTDITEQARIHLLKLI